MINLSRRKLILSGLSVTAGASGLAAAARLAQKYGLVPPDHGGIYGLGETLTYASQRLLMRHSLAREFPRSRISPRPFPNELAPLTEDFKRLQAGGFADWRLSIDGMVYQPASFSIADLRAILLAVRSPKSRVKRVGPTSPSGLAFRSPTCCSSLGCIQKPDMSCMCRWNRTRGTASIWLTLCIRRPFSATA